MSYKVLIPTAGIGSRLGKRTRYLNKSLISICGKPVLSRIIDMFPNNVEFIIPVGYKGELVKEYMDLVYHGRRITIVNVDRYEGHGSGLGLSISYCRQFLQEPFIFCSCDTLVLNSIPAPNHNWVGYGIRNDISSYRTLQINEDSTLIQICEKGECVDKNCSPYIGLAGIYDYNLFWREMDKGGIDSVLQGEVYGLKALLSKSVRAYQFDWFDTGCEEELEKTQLFLQQKEAPNILDKENESIWFVNQEVIKYSDDTNFITDRVKRAEILGNYVPQVTGYTKHMYKYAYVSGIVLSRCVQLPIFNKLLEYSKIFWRVKKLPSQEKQVFKNCCLKFYKNKTNERVQLFYKKFNKSDEKEVINGVLIPRIKDLLDILDWDSIANGLPGRFHGDYHFENIIYDRQYCSFVFLDWRQNFGNSLSVGDIYYDLGKLLHSLIVCHDLVVKGLYEVNWESKNINYNFNRKHLLVECERYYYGWLEEQGYDLKKVKIITSLIFLNIAALHHYPYGLLLYVLGKEMLFNLITQTSHIDFSYAP